ncbi:hypothetical protein ACQ4XT_08540 [Halobacillus faecis]
MMQGILNKYKTIIFEFGYNIFSFSLLIFAQQLFALPIIARFYDSDQFGKIVLAFGISNILTSMFGFSIGSARLLDEKYYNYNYLKIFYVSCLFISFISFAIYYFIIGGYLDSLIYVFICLLGSIRYFYLAEYRLLDSHSWVLKQNVFYFIGIVLGLVFFLFFQNWLFVFFIAELLSVVITSYSLYKADFFKLFKDRSDISLSNVNQLVINNGASYSLMYYDRFIIFPILGGANVSIYYSAAISSKIGGLIFNPLSNFILGKLSPKNSGNKVKIHRYLYGSIVVIMFYFTVSIITTPILVRILYPDFLSKIESVFIPICLGAAIMGGVNILKPLLMRQLSVKLYNELFYIYGITLVFLSIVLCFKYKLLGVAIANTFSSTLFFILVFWKLYRSEKK